jgi:hypothetical protein
VATLLARAIGKLGIEARTELIWTYHQLAEHGAGEA